MAKRIIDQSPEHMQFTSLKVLVEKSLEYPDGVPPHIFTAALRQEYGDWDANDTRNTSGILFAHGFLLLSFDRKLVITHSGKARLRELRESLR